MAVGPSAERFSDEESTGPGQTDGQAYSSTLELTLDDDGTAEPT